MNLAVSKVKNVVTEMQELEEKSGPGSNSTRDHCQTGTDWLRYEPQGVTDNLTRL